MYPPQGLLWFGLKNSFISFDFKYSCWAKKWL